MTAFAKHVGWTLGWLVALTAFGVGGLIVGEAVPDAMVLDALVEARAAEVIDVDQQPIDESGIGVDEFTECIVLSVGLGEEAGAGVLTTVAEAPHLGPCNRLVRQLDAYAGGQPFDESGTYLRYWHGTSAITRPLVALVGVAALRALTAVALVVAIAAVAGVVRRRFGTLAAVALLAPFVLTTSIVSLPGSTGQAIATVVGFAGAALVATVAVGGLAPARIWYPSVLAGAAFVYVDLLTVVPGFWLLPAALVGAVAFRAGESVGSVASWSLLSGAGWFVGYAGMWIGKWVFAAAVLGRRRVTDDVRQTVSERIDGESPYAEPGFGNAVDANVDTFLGRPLVPLLLVLTAITAVTRIARTDRRELMARAVVAATALVPFVWFEFASNHSQVHFWFTYRSLALSLGVVAFAATMRRPISGSDPSPAR